MFVVQYDDSGVVVSTGVIQDWAKPGAGFVKVTAEEYAQAQIGARKLEDGTYAPPPAPPEQLLVTQEEFQLLFTRAQWFALGKARETDADVFYLWSLIRNRNLIDLKHPAAAEFMAEIVAKDIVTAEEGARVLSGERPAPK